MNVCKLLAATFMSSILMSLSACEVPNNQPSKDTTSSGSVTKVEEGDESKQSVNPPVEQKLSQSELDSIYQVLDEYEGCIGSLIPQHVEEACQSIGGTMQPQGMAGCFSCVQQYSDGGQFCTDGSECQGDCRGWMDMEQTEGGDFSGHCAYDDSIFGCYSIIKEGKQVSGGCID